MDVSVIRARGVMTEMVSGNNRKRQEFHHGDTEVERHATSLGCRVRGWVLILAGDAGEKIEAGLLLWGSGVPACGGVRGGGTGRSSGFAGDGDRGVQLVCHRD